MILGPWKRLRIKDSNFNDRRPYRKGPSHTGYTGKWNFTVDSILLNSPLASGGRERGGMMVVGIRGTICFVFLLTLIPWKRLCNHRAWLLVTHYLIMLLLFSPFFHKQGKKFTPTSIKLPK